MNTIIFSERYIWKNISPQIIDKTTANAYLLVALDAWMAHASFLEAIMAEIKSLDECDVVVPVNKIPSYLEFVKKFGEECGLVIKSFGHAGDGNLHIYQYSNYLEKNRI